MISNFLKKTMRSPFLWSAAKYFVDICQTSSYSHLDVSDPQAD